MQTIMTCLNIMYPGKFVTVSCHFSSHVNTLGRNKPMETVWELFVKDNYCKEFYSLEELFNFIKLEYVKRKLDCAL